MVQESTDFLRVSGSSIAQPAASRTVFCGRSRPRVLLIIRLHLPGSAAMIRGITRCHQVNSPWTVFLDDQSRTFETSYLVLRQHWDGVLSQQVTPELAAVCAELEIPLVSLDDAEPPPGISSFRLDHYAVGGTGATHLVEQKYKHFAFCGLAGVPWSDERKAGFCDTLRAVGRECSTYDEDPTEAGPWGMTLPDRLRDWVAGLRKETAVMACDDVAAMNVIHAAEAAGLMVPGDLAVLGANNDSTRCELGEPTISSIAANPFLAGELAAEHLRGLMAGETLPVCDQKVLPVGVVARMSTDRCDARDKNVRKAIVFVRDHACEGISVDRVLEHVHMSRSQLESKFRRYLGRSPQAEIRRVQVEKAGQLLVETDLCVKEIAGQVGFKHAEYMSVVFKRVTGQAPGEFRQCREGYERARALAGEDPAPGLPFR